MALALLRSKWERGDLIFYSNTIGGRMQVGETDDLLYGGDMSNDDAGDGITVVSADGKQHFGLAVYADDGDNALEAGWVSGGFFSMKNYNAIAGGINTSVIGLTGQVHAGASINSGGNVFGVAGWAETVSGVTITTAPFFGGNFSATIPSGATLAANTYAGGILISGSYGGTITGNLVGIYFQNPSNAQYDYAFAFGQNAQFAGMVTVAAVGGSNTHKLKVIAGGTDYFIPMYTS